MALTRVEGILAPENRHPVEARNDSRPMPPANIPPSASRRDRAFDEPVDEFIEYHGTMPRRAYPSVEEREEGLLAGPRRLMNRAFDALDEMADWVLGRRY